MNYTMYDLTNFTYNTVEDKYLNIIANYCESWSNVGLQSHDLYVKILFFMLGCVIVGNYLGINFRYNSRKDFKGLQQKINTFFNTYKFNNPILKYIKGRIYKGVMYFTFVNVNIDMPKDLYDYALMFLMYKILQVQYMYDIISLLKGG